MPFETRVKQKYQNLSNHKFSSKQKLFILNLTDKFSITEISNRYLINRNTIYSWKKRFIKNEKFQSTTGREKIFDSNCQNQLKDIIQSKLINRTPLSKDQVNNSINLILENDCNENGKNFKNPSDSTLKRIQNECGVTYRKPQVISPARLNA